MVAGFDADHPGADLLHDAGALVAADHRERDGDVAGDEVGVGVAQPRGRQADEDLLLPGRVEVDLLDAPLLAETPQDGGGRLHTSVLASIIFWYRGKTLEAMGTSLRIVGTGPLARI